MRGYNQHMRIHLERTGGFAGRRVEVSLDSDSLTLTQAKRLRTLIARSRFFDLPVRLSSIPVTPDRFHYRVTVEEDDKSHTVEAAEAEVPVQMRPLLDWLLRLEHPS